MESDIEIPVRTGGNGRRLNGEEMRGGGGGSVKRARQKAKADLPPDELLIGTPPPPVNPILNDSPPQASTSTEMHQDPHPQVSRQSIEPPFRSLLRPQLNPLLAPGLHLSPSPPWSQPYGNSFRPEEMENSTKERAFGKGPPPQRPPRPSDVPSIFSSESIEHEGRQLQQEHRISDQKFIFGEDHSKRSQLDGVQASNYNNLSTEPNRIPEFPSTNVPPLFSQIRRSPNLGPPPSSRKGASMYYSPNSFVAPIPEEISEGHSSFASSHVIPTSWGDGPPDSYVEEGIEEEDEAKLVGQKEVQAPKVEDPVSEKMVRKHSSRRRSRASSKEFFSADVSPNWGKRVQGNQGQDSISNMYDGHPSPGAFGPETTAAKSQRSPATTFHGTTFLAPPSGNSSPNLSPISPTNVSSLSRSTTNASLPSPFFGSRSPVDPRVDQILSSLERGHYGASTMTTPFTSTAPSMSEKGPKRPLRLNIAATKDVDVRNSQSSLPELIRRATRLASNLDRGKTASRLGLLDVANTDEKHGHVTNPNSISDILAAFPSPSVGTPSGGRRSPRWGSPSGRLPLSRDQETISDFQKRPRYKEPEGRRIWGIPVWALILLIVVLVLLIAAAVIIPVTLIVLPRQRHAAPATVASCLQNYPCINGGTNIVKDNSCRCICVNGFAGSACGTVPDQSCTTFDVNIQQSNIHYRNATAATGIPRLLSAASQNFSIALDSEALLSLFSSRNLSCSDENHLITLNNRLKRRNLPQQFAIPRAFNIIDEPLPSPQIHSSTPCISHEIYARDIPYPSGANLNAAKDNDVPGAITSNSIIFAAPTNDQSVIPGVNTGLIPQATPTGISSPSSPSTPEVPEKAYDFARTVILFIFQDQATVSQDQALNSAFDAKNQLQSVLANVKTYNLAPVSAGGKVKVDFATFTVDLGNGTTLGNGLSNLAS